MAKSLLDTYSMLRDHQARVAKWVKLWHHSFDILSKPRPCWTAEETAYVSRMDNFSAVCHKSVLRSGTHLGATFDRAHEHTIEAAKKLAVPARDVDVLKGRDGRSRASSTIATATWRSTMRRWRARSPLPPASAPSRPQLGGRSVRIRRTARWQRTPICRGRMASASPSPTRWPSPSPTRSLCCSGQLQSPQAPCACGAPGPGGAQAPCIDPPAHQRAGGAGRDADPR